MSLQQNNSLLKTTNTRNLKPSTIKHFKTSHTRWQSHINDKRPYGALTAAGVGGGGGGGGDMSTSLDREISGGAVSLFSVTMHVSFAGDTVLKTDHKCTLTRSSAPFVLTLPPAQGLLSLA